jgi:hypothetical protein
VSPTASTTEVDEDVNGEPLGALPMGPAAATTEVKEGRRWWAPNVDLGASTVNIKNIDSGAPGRCRSW